MVKLTVANDMAGLERRSLPYGSVLAQSLAGAIPASMALALPSFLGRTVGPGAWLCVLIAGVVMWLINLCMCEFTSRVATSGSMFTFVALGLGPRVALVAGTSMLVGYGAFASYGFAKSTDYAMNLATSPAASAGGGAQISVVMIVGCVLLLGALCLWVMARGVRLASRVTMTIEAFTIAVLVLLVAWSLWERGGVSVADITLAGADPGKIAQGTVSTFAFFYCFEAASSLGTETAQPLRNVPRATSAATLLMVGLSLMATLLAPVTAAGTQGSGTEAFWFPGGSDHEFLTTTIDVVRMLSYLAAALAVWTCLSRLVFTWARAHLVPASLGRTHPSMRTPRAALVVTSIFVLGPALLLTSVSGDGLWARRHIADISDICFLVFYILTCVASVGFVARIGELQPRNIVIAVVPTVVLIWVGWSYLSVEFSNRDFAATGTLIVVGVLAVIWSLFIRRLGPCGLSNADTYDEPVLADVRPDLAPAGEPWNK